MTMRRRPQGLGGGQFTSGEQTRPEINLVGSLDTGSLADASASDEDVDYSTVMTSDTGLDAYVAHPDPLVRAAVARNRHLTPEQESALMAPDQPRDVRLDMANRRTDWVMEIAAADPDPWVRVLAFGAPRLSASARSALHRDGTVRRLANLVAGRGGLSEQRIGDS